MGVRLEQGHTDTTLEGFCVIVLLSLPSYGLGGWILFQGACVECMTDPEQADLCRGHWHSINNKHSNKDVNISMLVLGSGTPSPASFS